MHCPACHTENADDRLFCSSCGARLPKCSHCGFINEPNASFCGGCGRSMDVAPVDVGSPPTRARPAVPGRKLPKEGERRQITVMFCDLVGSTSLSNQLDPEDLREVIRAFQNVATASIERHGGFVARYMGDGIMVYYGYPQANEDDAERAVRTALDVVAEVARLRPLPEVDPDLRIDARVGIATGLAVVGDPIGIGMSREEAVVGRTPNLAARLQGMAEPGGIVISRETRNLVADLFACRSLGKLRLKGFEEQVPACAVLGECAIENRFEAVRPFYDRVPLTGRDAELERLLAAWRRACGGQGQVVLVRGDAGIGKSRMMQTLRDHVAKDNHIVLRYYCAPRFRNTALFPIVNHLKEAAGIDKDDPPETALDKLEGLFAPSEVYVPVPETVPYLAALLSIPIGGRYPPVLSTPERQRQRVFELLASKLVALARDRAVLVLFEDLHWIDPTSLQLLERLIEAMTELPVLLLATGRPEFEPPWSVLATATTVELQRLNRDNSLRVLAAVTGGKALPDEIVEQILAKSDGVPLFLEEITKSVLESNRVREAAEGFELAGPLRSLAVPSSLQDSLMARLDRLGAAKDVAQIGAAIGRHFSLDLLAAVSPLPEPELRPAIERLVDSDLVECRELAGEQVCIFKHVLLQEAAQAMMLRGSRQRLHGQIAAELESRLERGIETAPELLAHHYAAARMPNKAVPYWQQAGILAGSRAAHTEAIRHFRTAIEWLSRLPKNATRHRLELEIRINLGLSLIAARGYAAPEVEDTYQRARELAHSLDQSIELFPVVRGLCSFYMVRAQLATAHGLAEQCVRLGERSRDPAHLIEGLTALGYTQFFMGDIGPSRAALEQSLALYQQHDGRLLQFPATQDPASSDRSLLSLVAWMQGNNDESLRHSREAIEIAVALKRPFDLAFTHCFAAMFYNMRREPEAAAAEAARVVELATEYGFDIWLAAGTLHTAIARAALGEAEQAVGLMEDTLDAWQQAGAGLNQPFFLAGLAEIHRQRGQFRAALTAVDQAIDHAARHRERFYDSVLFRLRGELELQTHSSTSLAEQGEADLLYAIEVARTRGARMLELEARCSLHEWRLRSSRPDPQADALRLLYAELAPACAGTVPLGFARSLLDANDSA